jgi:hypothetical protein
VALLRFLALASAKVAWRPFAGAAGAAEDLLRFLAGSLSASLPRWSSLALYAMFWALRRCPAEVEARMKKELAEVVLEFCERAAQLAGGAGAALGEGEEEGPPVAAIPSWVVSEPAPELWEGFSRDGLVTRLGSACLPGGAKKHARAALELDEAAALDPLAGPMSCVVNALPVAALLARAEHCERWKAVYFGTITHLRGTTVRGCAGLEGLTGEGGTRFRPSAPRQD